MEMPNMKKAMILTVASLLTAFVFTGCENQTIKKAIGGSPGSYAGTREN